MFNRRIIILIILVGISAALLWWNWETPKSYSLQGSINSVSSQRWNIDLSGVWDEFSSLRQAWATENEMLQDHQKESPLTQGTKFMIPSNKEFQVAAKRFRLPGEWSARTMQLVLNKVKGHAVIYLNGIDSGHKIGEFEGIGGEDVLEIPPAAFKYGNDNILIIQLSKNLAEQQSLFSSPFSGSGQAAGRIYLEAVTETTLTMPDLTVNRNGDSAEITIQTNLVHHNFQDNGPWTVTAELSDGSADAAHQTIIVKKDKNREQAITFKLKLPEARFWKLSDPFLYQLYLKVSNRKGDIDNLAIPIGLRTLSVKNGVWLLNGEKVTVKGVVLSEDERYSIQNTGKTEAWLNSQKKAGKTLVYFTGMYPDEIWLRAADKVGIGVWAEWPPSMIPWQRMPSPAAYQNLAVIGNLHSSVWAYTVFKELNANLPEFKQYLSEAKEMAKPNLVFAMGLRQNSDAFQPQSDYIIPENNKITGPWGEITGVEDITEKHRFWQGEELAAGIWAVLMIIVLLMNISTASWRYKQILEEKPRRKLRTAWFWEGLAVFGREGTLAGIAVSGIYHLQLDINPWFANLWPALNHLKLQSPWLIWAVLCFSFVLLRLLQVGVAAPHLPQSPHPLGLAYWLERRYRWAAAIAFVWALAPFGIPLYYSAVGYIALDLLFLPFRIKDIHRIGGTYRPLLIVPSVIGVGIIIWAVAQWVDFTFVWQSFAG